MATLRPAEESFAAVGGLVYEKVNKEIKAFE